MKPAAHFLRPRVTASVWLWLAVFGFLIGTAALANLAWIELGRTEQIELALSVREDAQQRVVVPRKSTEDTVRLRHWAEFRAERDFPWARVFESIEQSDRNNIELLEFRPEKTNLNIILRGEALDGEALAAYVESLAGQPALRQIHLLHLQTVKREKFSTVSFEVKAAIK